MDRHDRDRRHLDSHRRLDRGCLDSHRNVVGHQNPLRGLVAQLLELELPQVLLLELELPLLELELLPALAQEFRYQELLP